MTTTLDVPTFHRKGGSPRGRVVRARLADESGFSLLEILAALVIFGMVAAGGINLIRQQETVLSLGGAQMDALQGARFAAETLERNIRNAGAHTAPGQPFLVYADTSAIAINADYVSSNASDVFAVYVNPTAPPEETGGLTRARRFRLPGSSFTYPDSTYREGAVTTSAETITFYFAPDSTSTRGDDYVLYRQVNDLAPEAISRGLLKVEGRPFFEYQEVISGDTIAPRPQWVPAGALPLAHRVPIHLSPADTGSFARIDRVRAVRVTFTAAAGDGPTEQLSPLRRLIHMPNAGQRSLRTCGEDPLFTSGVGAGQVAGEARVQVTWNASFDESSGESDVVRYAIFRRELPQADWGEPYFSVPAGLSSYVYIDGQVSEGSTYQYAVAAQDCTPSISELRISPQVTVNP